MHEPLPSSEKTTSLSQRIIYIVICLAAVLWNISALYHAIQAGKGSDIVRQWVVCKYVIMARNPYQLSKDILNQEYGPASDYPNVLFETPTPRLESLKSRIDPKYGPPEATYPPSSVGILVMLVGWLPTTLSVLYCWSIANVILISLLSALLFKSESLNSFNNVAAGYALIIAFSPFWTSIVQGAVTPLDGITRLLHMFC